MGVEAHVVRSTDVQQYQLADGAWLRMFEGAEHGLGDVTLIITEYPPGSDTDIKHRHPHISTLVVTHGQGRLIGDEVIEATVGDVVVVPANAWHTFVNSGDDVLRVVGVNDSSRHAHELWTDDT